MSHLSFVLHNATNITSRIAETIFKIDRTEKHVTTLYIASWYRTSAASRDSSVGIATRYGLDGQGIESWWGGEIFRTRPDRPCRPPSLLYKGYRVFPGGKAAGSWPGPPTPSSAEVKGRV